MVQSPASHDGRDATPALSRTTTPALDPADDRAASRKEVPFYIQAARLAPLGVAIVAPVVTLLDIPALSQRWFKSEDGTPFPDPHASIALSIVSLVFCVVGNVLMLLRFSATTTNLKAVISFAPLLDFTVKTVAEVVNLCVFGRVGQKPDGYFYSEAFWCAVFSCGLSGACAVMLAANALAGRGRVSHQSIRSDGRQFMLVVLVFVLSIGIQALVFSKLEGWLYLDGVYFSIVSCLTVGYGDLVPTRTSTKILLFPFALSAIALLANVVSLIVGHIGRRTSLRRAKWRAQRALLSRRGRTLNEQAKEWGLSEEIAFLESMQRKEHRISQVYDVALSLLGLVVFWILGAIVFEHLEADWTYGDAIYYVYITFLTIGYGDFAPTTPSSRVFFIVYSLMAVPVVAAFAVQTVITLMENITESAVERAQQRREAKAAERQEDPEQSAEPADDPSEPSETHAHLVLDHWQRIRHEVRDETSDKERKGLELQLAKKALSLACQLETEARLLLIATLPTGSKAQTLLRADRNVQRRDVMLLGAEGPEQLGALWEAEDHIRPGAGEEGLLASINTYRKTFAELLVVGSQLLRHEEHERHLFLRTRAAPESASQLSEPEPAANEEAPFQQAEKEMLAMDAADGDVEVELEDGELEISPRTRSDVPAESRSQRCDGS